MSATSLSTRTRIVDNYISNLNFLKKYSDDYYKISNMFLEKIKKIYSGRSDFFYKSHYLLLFPYINYVPYKDGLLLGNSLNSLFTIADIVEEESSSDNKLFIKIINYNSQRVGSNIDLAIYDIIISIIFEDLLTLSSYVKYRDFISIYKGCSLSYHGESNGNKYWDFNYFKTNDIIDEVSNNKKCIVIMYEAITDPIALNNLFFDYCVKTGTEKEKLNSMITDTLLNIYDFYKFMIEIGVKYGFMHNDLHFGNLLYNPTTKKIALIDFGHSSFALFIDYTENIINDIIFNEYIKINFNEKLNIVPQVTNKSLVQNCIHRLYFKDIFRYNISKTINGKYFGIIFDLITFSMGMYVRLLYYIKETNQSEANDIERLFNNIFHINYNNDLKNLPLQKIIMSIPEYNFDILIKENFKNAYDYIKKLDDSNVNKKNYKILLEGLLYTALYCIFNKITYNLNITDSIFFSFQVMNNNLNEFKEYFVTTILNNSEYMNILKDDEFLQNFIPEIRTGGRGQVITDAPSTMTNYIKSYNSPIIENKTSPLLNSSLESTVNAYEKIYENKKQFSFINKNHTLSPISDESEYKYFEKKGGRIKKILKRYK
jgi:hypothetical protein